MAAAEAFAGGDPFAVINSDNYYPVEALRARQKRRAAPWRCSSATPCSPAAMSANSGSSGLPWRSSTPEATWSKSSKSPTSATLAALPKPLWVSMNCWRFGPSIFEACRAIRPSPRGEFELPGAVQHAMHALGETFHALTIRAPVLDLTSREDIASVAAILKPREVKL